MSWMDISVLIRSKIHLYHSDQKSFEIDVKVFWSDIGRIIVWVFLSLTVTALWHLNRHFCVTSKWLDEAFVSILMNLLLTFCLKTMAKQSPTMLCKCKCKCKCKWKVVLDFYRTRVRSLFTLVTNSLTDSLTHSLPFSKKIKFDQILCLNLWYDWKKLLW